MTATVHLAPQPRALDQNIFHAKAEAFLVDVSLHGQLQLGLFDSECPFQDRLHAQCAFHASASR